ncbi:hydantoinase B/oxoprolinase family protein [Solirubrobacter sp. CPCC 204708]|uniref:Hydantoinase B/oxoprolinase family protein n=1 Tax=Solirubrobacter deserti TaxID=2282478 RepID=A0ABT4RJ46_9ACTN|nr:hydantoinase B/oxoprolinase family protein [Solirubrobacter deserti]MBE2317634.1 hydantoinase B/oxoprolinase family protein [Solirubrobacter deserti]MDA0138584.1 hydantoinase B/oxoprolinase family protein [Solirubrobacter deserti]
MTLDPVTVGIAAGRLTSILDEQQATLVRTAFSTIVRESEDLACGVFDRAGRMLGQSHSGTPGHINAMATGLEHVVNAYPADTLDPGDVLITNDPWMTAGQINDLTVVTPVFRGERTVGFFASTCHAPDIGGRLLSAEASDVFEEGLRLPILKLARGGEMNEDLLALIRANVRTPRETVGDLYAQMAANDVGARSLLRCLDDLGLEDLEAVGAEIRRRSEDAMRAAIAKLPDGRYEATGYSDGFGERIVLQLAAIIDGDEITLDFAGSSPQSEHGINVVLNYTHAYASFALKAAVAPGVPHNDGSFTPVHVTAPEGSILNCRPPAPVASRHAVGHFLPGVVLAALAPVLERHAAGSSDALWITVWSPFNLTLFQSGGAGAWSGRDGRNSSGFPSAVASVPTEVFELSAPVVQRERSLRTDSGGAGRWRGGLGQTSIMSLREGDAWRVSALGDRTTVPAPGADGGHDGAVGEITVDGSALPTKRLTSLAPDAHVRLDLPGGGGVGDPRERDPQAVLRDVVDGYVSVEAAKTLYGVTVRQTREGRVLGPEDFEIEENA